MNSAGSPEASSTTMSAMVGSAGASVVVADPTLVGCRTLTPLAPLEVRGGIHEPAPAAALGVSDAGTAATTPATAATVPTDPAPTTDTPSVSN